MRYRSEHHRYIRSIATINWLLYVQEQMNNISLGEVQRHFSMKSYDKENPFWPNCSGKLYKNMRGIPVCNNQLIDNIEKEIKGSKRLLKHPLWKVLETPRMTLNSVHNLMKELSPNIVNRLFKEDALTGNIIRKQLTRKDQITRIAMMNNLDALACLLLFVRESELLNESASYIQAKWGVDFLLKRFLAIYPYSSIMDDIYEIVYQSFIDINNPLPITMFNRWVIEFPEYFECPKKQPQLYFVVDSVKTILYYAELRGFVSQDKMEQLNFLFWVQNFCNSKEIVYSLIKLEHTFQYDENNPLTPEPLIKLMNMINGDSRQYIKTDRFL